MTAFEATLFGRNFFEGFDAQKVLAASLGHYWIAALQSR
jgi:hypothetical protein